MKQTLSMWIAAVFILALGMASVSYAEHPLITDDAMPLGKGKVEIELNGEYSYDKEKEEGITAKEKETEIEAEMTYGILDNLDIKLGIPYMWIKLEIEDESEKDNGVGDISLALKYRFLQRDNFSLALKPEITLPTGDEDKDLGTGRVTYGLYFIGTGEAGPVEISANLGYIRNDNKIEEEKDIFHASLAAVYEIVHHLELVGNIGIETNRDPESSSDPAFILGGLIYEINENIRIDGGVKFGLNDPEVDYAFLAGIAFEF